MVAYAVRDTDLLFTSTAGTPLSRNNFRTKYWAPAVTAAKIPQTVTFHNLRAAHASWLLAGGADIIVIQDRLGQVSRFLITLDTEAIRYGLGRKSRSSRHADDISAS